MEIHRKKVFWLLIYSPYSFNVVGYVNIVKIFYIRKGIIWRYFGINYEGFRRFGPQLLPHIVKFFPVKEAFDPYDSIGKAQHRY
jgi:hypothetical protein